MRIREDYTRHIAVALGLTLAVLLLFQVYIFREPDRIAGVEARDKSIAVNGGRDLFARNCAPCHGSEGEGDIGPSLNDKQFLSTTSDDTIFSVISSGVPGTQMPAWNQSHGGPLTDQDVTQLVTFIRDWQATAPDRQAMPAVGDPANGATIYRSVCVVCHGDNGQGTDRAPALNDPVKLSQFDDAWYKATIANGRPSKGMPTWGTVLSPQQILNLVALLDAWRSGQNVPGTTLPTPVATATPAASATPTETVEIARPSNSGGPGPALSLVGDPKSGETIFTENCQKCHGEQGVGNVPNPGSDDGTIPPLNPIDETLVNSDLKVFAYNLDLFLEHGSTPEGPSPKETMPAWGDEGKLTPQQIADVIAYVMSLNPTTPATPVAEATPTAEIARPSNPGGAGPALSLTGDAQSGETIFTENCQKCHGPQGVGNMPNPGSDDGTIPPLNPIDETLVNSDLKVFAYNLDLFVEHGSTPEGPNPKETMPAWGDEGKLTPQQIADVIAYVISLNK